MKTLTVTIAIAGVLVFGFIAAVCFYSPSAPHYRTIGSGPFQESYPPEWHTYFDYGLGIGFAALCVACVRSSIRSLRS